MPGKTEGVRECQVRSGGCKGMPGKTEGVRECQVRRRV